MTESDDEETVWEGGSPKRSDRAVHMRSAPNTPKHSASAQPFQEPPAEARGSCPDDNMLFAFGLGELSPSECGPLQAHIRTCSDCRDVLAEALANLSSDESVSAPAAVQSRIERYELLELIGSGGAGVVYRAYDPALKREVAIKILRPDLLGTDHSTQKRLRREAQAMAQLSHPNVITAYDVGESESGVFIVVEYHRGGSLDVWLKTEPPLEKRLDYLIRAGRGLEAAHARGIVHRDFKPHNVLVSDGDRVCVTDFVLARFKPISEAYRLRMQSSIGDATLTRGLMGTPNYMAPEVMAGRGGNEASDQFSYCVTLYRALTGTHPFKSDQSTHLSELLARMQADLMEPLSPEIPEHVRAVLSRGLKADPSERFESMTALLAALEARPVSRTPRLLLVGLVGAVALGVALSVAGASWSASGPRPGDLTPSAATTPATENTRRPQNAPHAQDKPPEHAEPGNAPGSDARDARDATQDRQTPKAEATSAQARPSLAKAKAPSKKPSPPKGEDPAPRSETQETRYNDWLRDPF